VVIVKALKRSSNTRSRTSVNTARRLLGHSAWPDRISASRYVWRPPSVMPTPGMGCPRTSVCVIWSDLGLGAPKAKLQQQTAATNPRPGGCGRACTRLARHERGSARPAPPLCKQGVRGSSPLGSTPSQRGFAPALWLYFSARTAESTAISTPCKFLNALAQPEPTCGQQLKSPGLYSW
jgi:hypothetical protein